VKSYRDLNLPFHSVRDSAPAQYQLAKSAGKIVDKNCIQYCDFPPEGPHGLPNKEFQEKKIDEKRNSNFMHFLLPRKKENF